MSNVTKKKKKSQIPVALVYFMTLILFLVVFAFAAKLLMDKIDNSNSEPDQPVVYIESYNTLYARVNSKGVLSDLCVIRVATEKEKILVTPISAFTISSTDNTSNLREVYENGGTKGLQSAVNKTFDINTDFYMTVSNDAFESFADFMGGIVYTPEEELYSLSQENDNNDIIYPEGQTASIDGKQIRLICQTPVFKEGRNGNMKFLGEAMYQLINNGFQQSSFTKNNLDNIFNILTENSDTNITKNDFKIHKSYFNTMLSKQLTPAIQFVPEGTWTDDKFVVSDDFKKTLATAYYNTEPDALQNDSEESSD